LLLWTEFPKEYYKSIGFSEEQIDVLYPACEDFGEEKIPHDGINILFVDKGDRKGRTFAIQSFEEIHEEYPQTTLHYMHPSGSKPSHSSQGIRYQEYVPYEEFRENVLPKSDILLYPSKYESYGYTLLEAHSHSIPCVVTDTPVTRDIVEQGSILVEREVSEFTNALAKLVENPGHRSKMAHEARENYESRFTLEDFRQRLINSYRETIIRR
jgi:glycosyltransferase involved in cell wall biosynthesis